SGSPLAKKASVCLAVDHAEDSTTFLSMISRVLQLLLIDILSVGISLGGRSERDDAVAGADQHHMLISHLGS
ncbi:MAG TPA: bifunctional transcriptional regulator/glucokinase, partial [Telluria sp.]